jgi:putative Flp pilus-assembly TadE/G-like protein
LPEPKKPITHFLQRGQASVFVMLFMAILLVSALALFKAGKLTSNKMQLQNAADAAAFSMSTVEARDLNFAAYMNRAIVANEVAIGQMVGLASWAYHIKSIADFIDTYNNLFLAPATLGVSTGIVTPITTTWRSVGSGVFTVMKTIAKFGTLVVHNINKIYGGASFGYHTVSIIFAVGVLDDVITQNGPPGTQISDFGIVSLIAHIMTYGVLPNQLGIPGQFASGYMPNRKTTYDEFTAYESEVVNSSYARLSALIRDSRDPFTRMRGWELPLFETLLGDPIDETFGDSIKFDIFVASLEVGFDFHFAAEITLGRYGGSELRLVVPTSKTVKKQYAKGFNWSAADTTQLSLYLAISMRLWAEACAVGICETVSIGGGVSVGGDELEMYISVLGEKIFLLPTPLGVILAPPGITSMPFPTNYPFSAGFAEAGRTTSAGNVPSNNLGTLHMTTDGAPSPIPPGPVSAEPYDPDTNPNAHYGSAGQGTLAWYSPGPGPIPPPGIASLAQVYQTTYGTLVAPSYGGLPHFVDTTGNESLLGVGAPNLIIGLIQNETDFDSTTTSEPSGRFGLSEAMADNELAVMAKSELYFSRPTDRLATHFHRGDGLTEYGNAFNPYWQARLVETSYADRIMALLIQQKEDFMQLGVAFNLFFNNLLSYLPSI